VISEKSFSFNNEKYRLEAPTKKYFDFCKGLEMPDDKSIVLARFCSEFTKKLESKKDLSHEEFVELAKGVLVQSAHKNKFEIDILTAQIELLK
jgi:hypothetical protein